MASPFPLKRIGARCAVMACDPTSFDNGTRRTLFSQAIVSRVSAPGSPSYNFVFGVRRTQKCKTKPRKSLISYRVVNCVKQPTAGSIK